MSDRKFMALTLLAMVVGGFFLLLTFAQIREANTPHCPTEDSCSIDYRDGAWHITEER